MHSSLVPLEKLIARQTVSRTMDEHHVPVSAFTALQDLARTGKLLRLGQTVRLIYHGDCPRARALDAVTDFDLRTVNTPRYRLLLDHAVDTALQPITGENIILVDGCKTTFLSFSSRQDELKNYIVNCAA